jgi:hypothetical protein
MGWLEDHKIRRMTDPADGTLLVSGTSNPPFNAMYSNFSLAGVVEAPGLAPTAVQLSGLDPVASWPQPGQRLPVTVDRARPDNVVIHWDQMPTASELALAQAQTEALVQQTGTDPAVLAEAIQQAGGPTGPTGSAQAQPRWAAPPATATVPVTATVVSVTDVGTPPGFGPAGGIADLTVQLTDGAGTRTAVVRASFASAEQRERTACAGAQVRVLVDPANPASVAIDPGAV